LSSQEYSNKYKHCRWIYKIILLLIKIFLLLILLIMNFIQIESIW